MADCLRIWGPQLSQAISDYDGTDDEIILGADLTAYLADGAVVKITGASGDFAGNNGVQTIEGTPTFAIGVMTIPVAGNLDGGASGNKGTLIWRKYVDFDDFSRLDPQWNDPRTRLQGRYHDTILIRPGDTTAQQRFVQALLLNLNTLDFDTLTSSGHRFQVFLREMCVTADEQLLFFTIYDGVESDGTAYSEKYCYTGYLTEVPPWLYGTKTGVDGALPELTLTFDCIGNTGGTAGDGTYTDFDDPSSTTFRARPA